MEMRGIRTSFTLDLPFRIVALMTFVAPNSSDNMLSDTPESSNEFKNSIE